MATRSSSWAYSATKPSISISNRVAWREGGGYSCWAVLPPECGDGHIISAEVIDRYCPRDRFICVETRNINVHIDKTIIINDVTVINKTVNIRMSPT